MGLFDQLIPHLDKHADKFSNNLKVMADELIKIRYAVQEANISENTTVTRITLTATDNTFTVPMGQMWDVSYISADNADINLSVNGIRVMGHATAYVSTGDGLMLYGGDKLLFTPAGATVIYMQAKVSMLTSERVRFRDGQDHDSLVGAPGVEHRSDLLSDVAVAQPDDPYDRIPSTEDV